MKIKDLCTLPAYAGVCPTAIEMDSNTKYLWIVQLQLQLQLQKYTLQQKKICSQRSHAV